MKKLISDYKLNKTEQKKFNLETGNIYYTVQEVSPYHLYIAYLEKTPIVALPIISDKSSFVGVYHSSDISKARADKIVDALSKLIQKQKHAEAKATQKQKNDAMSKIFEIINSLN